MQIDAILGWREENLPQLPQCAQAIELGFLLSKLTIRRRGPVCPSLRPSRGDDNPYINAVEDMREKLHTWRKDSKLALSEYRAPPYSLWGRAATCPFVAWMISSTPFCQH